MAENKHKKSDKKSSGDSGRKLKWIVRGGIALVILAVLSWCIFKLPKMFFFQNQRVKFRNLEIDSTGYWQKQHKLLLESLQQRHQADLELIECAHRYPAPPAQAARGSGPAPARVP